ncbi:MAG: hypothetical protein ACJ77N_12345 [Chloroflexota bacterium]|jgi:hypothetical protein
MKTDQDPAHLETLLRSPDAAVGDIAGPVQVLSTTKHAGSGVEYEVQANRLIGADPDDPQLRDVSIAVPITVRLVVRKDGSLATASVEEPSDEEVHEARSYVRSLAASGAVRGIEPSEGRRPGPPTRATHEVSTDPDGRRVIKRIGFSLR